MKQDEFERIKEYALSNFDLLEAEPTKVVGYDDLEGMFNIDEVFDRKGRAILLYQTENENMGHWVALLKDGDTIEIYDPYGYNPKEWDKQLGGNMGSKTDTSLLTDLIKRSGYGYRFNKQRNQPVDTEINTCGRHALLRIVFYKYSLDEFNSIVKQIQKETGVSADDLATIYSYELIGK